MGCPSSRFQGWTVQGSPRVLMVRVEIRFRVSRGRLLEACAFSAAFLVPVLIRWVPEAQFPYPIGYDTPSYLAAAKAYSRSKELFPLFFRILGWLRSMGLDPVVAMKYLPTLLYGFLGVSVFYFARSYLGWDVGKGLLTVFVLVFSAVSLRISWDLNRQVFATMLLFLALSQIPKLRSGLRAALFIGLVLLVAASHELVLALMDGILAYLLLCEGFQVVKQKSVDRHFLAVVSVAFAGSLLVFVGGWFRWNLPAIYSTGAWSLVSSADAGYSPWAEALGKFGTLAILCYAPLAPLAVLGVFRRAALTGWVLVAMVGSFSIFASPWLSLRFPDRWMYLLIYPAAFFVVEAFGRLGVVDRLSLGKGLAMVATVVLVNFVSLSLLGISPWPAWYPRAPGFFPVLMPVSSIPLCDIEGTAQLMRSLDQHSQGSVLITHVNYFGWAAYYTDLPVIVWGPSGGTRSSLADALSVARAHSGGGIYLLWYWDADALDLGFVKIAESGPMKLYEYRG
jgi:hypothetical protein